MGNEIWNKVRSERFAVADLVESLDAEQWEEASLCRGWRVADVAGHLVYLAEGSHLRGTWHFWRYGRGYSPNKMIDATARRWGQASPAELAARLRAAAGGRYRLPGGPPVVALAEVVVHGEDIRRPLGLTPAERDPAELVPLLDVHRRLARWFLRGAARNLGLEATDVDWSTGTGDLVRGPALPLLLALTGRVSACDELTGDGVGALRSRSRAGV